jgi:hypothetical protein
VEWIALKNEKNSPKRPKPKPLTELIKTVLSSKDTEIHTNVQAAAQPLFLTRYE